MGVKEVTLIGGYCHHRALDFQARGLRERIVPSRPAPGEAFDCGLFDLIVEPIEGVSETEAPRELRTSGG